MIENIKLQEEKNGGILPLIPLIIGGIAATESVAGGTAGIVQAVNKSEKAALEEQKRHKRELEKVARGEGIVDNFFSKLN